MKDLLILFISILFCLAGNKLVAQNNCTVHLHNHDVPKLEDSNNSFLDIYIKKINNYLNQDINKIDHPNKKEVQEYYDDRVEHLSNLASKGHFYTDNDLLKKVNAIGDRLIAANDINNKSRIQWVINRTGNPNAACIGEGTLMINLGLISNLHNEDQLAFVMAHELGHYQLDHVNKKINKSIEFLNSKKLQKKLKDVSRDKEMAREELLEMLDEKSLSQSKHSRAYEVETDKLGYEFYIKAGFPADQAVETMKLLKNIDSGKYPPADLNVIFKELDQEWKPSWTKTKLSGLSLIKPDESEIEKYRTHPETDVRIKQLLELGGSEKEDNLDEDWCQMGAKLDLEILNYSYWRGAKFESFAFATQLLELNPENQFVKNIFAHCLLDFILAKEEHYFSNLVPAPNIRMKDHHFVCATFLDNINFSALKNLSISWIKKHVDFSNNSDESISALDIKMKMVDKTLEREQFEKFDTKWPDSHYID